MLSTKASAIVVLSSTRAAQQIADSQLRCTGQAAMGSFGRALVVCLAMTEFFGASCMDIIVIWRTLAELMGTGALSGRI